MIFWGGIAKRLKAADCKSVSKSFVGSNPTSSKYPIHLLSNTILSQREKRVRQDLNL